MKKFLAIIITPVLMMVLAAPVLAQVNLPYATDLVISDGTTTLDVGDLIVRTDGNVSFQIDEYGTDWRLAETALYVGDTPPLKIKPARFPYQHDGLGGTAADEFNIDLATVDINGDGIIYIAACATLVRQAGVKKNGRITYAEETAWALGEESMGRGKNQMSFFAVTVSEPTTEPGGPIG